MKTFTILSSAVLLATAAFGQENYLNYKIPPEALKFGPHPTRDPDKQEVLYFIGLEKTRENLVGVEVFEGNVLVQRDLLKGGKKHGVQMEWYGNGNRKREAPYKDGLMEGTFREWNKWGDLVGEYTMSVGTGVVLVYNAAGQLVKEDHYKANSRDGLRMERVGDKISLTWSKDGHRVWKGYDFFESGELATLVSFSDDGMLNGPVVEFTPEGKLKKASWYTRGREVDKASYESARSKDPNLPAYVADANRYKQIEDEGIIKLLEKYRKMPRVRIPLKFDKDRNPIRAE